MNILILISFDNKSDKTHSKKYIKNSNFVNIKKVKSYTILKVLKKEKNIQILTLIIKHLVSI